MRSGFLEDYRVRYAPKVVWTITSAGHLVIGCPRAMSFDVIMPDGEVMQSESVSYEPVPISPDELNWFREGMAAGIAETRRMNVVADADVPIPHADEESLQFDYPDVKPAFKSIVVADDGRLWVRLSPPSVEYPIPAHGSAGSSSADDTYWGNRLGGAFEVFTSHGEHIGHAELPLDVWIDPDMPYSVPPVIAGDHLWAVALDSLNVQYVTRYRIVWP